MNHYVYIITNLMNGKKYIGKRSCKHNIENDKYMGSGLAITYAIKKYGIENFEKKILLVCDTEEEAFDEERKAIQLVKAWENPMYYNISGGGEGFGSGEGHPFYGKCRSDKTKKKLSKAHTGKKLSEETKRKISESKKGVRLSEETKVKLGLLRKGKNNHKAKCVVNLNTNKIFDTLTEAAKWCNLTSSTSIIRCCKGEQKSSCKHPKTGEYLTWRYLEDYEKMTKEEIKLAIEYANEILCGKNHHNSKSVICLNTHEIFDTVKDASVWCGTGHGNIVKNCQGKRKSAGKLNGEKLRWMYLQDYEEKYGETNQKIS